MRRWLWIAFTGLLIAGMVTGGYVMFTPKIGHATSAQIYAALPASLKVEDVPDLEGEARYRRLTEIVKAIDKEPLWGRVASKTDKSTPENEALLARIEALIQEGKLQVPKRDPKGLYPESAAFKDAANLIRLAVHSARERGDRTACERWATLGLRYVNALKGSGGVVVDELVHVAIDAIVLRAIYLAEINGGFDAEGQDEILRLMKPSDGSSPTLAEAVRRDFQTYWMPLLLDPEGHKAELMLGGEYEYGSDESPSVQKLAGTFDPLETAKLAGTVYDAMISDLRRPLRQAKHAEKPILEKMEKGLPSMSYGSGPEEYWYRVRMNLGRNTLGRQALIQTYMVTLGEATARSAATRNIVRTVILLRLGQRPTLPDPQGTGPLRIDLKRKIVWSVGKDGTNDGGAIGRGWENQTVDYGAPYGDRSWAPLTSPFAPAGPPLGFPAGGPPDGPSD